MGLPARARHKKILAKAKGYREARGRVFRVAKQAVTRAGQYAYRDRRAKKRDFRALWIVRINAAARLCGLYYRVRYDRRPHQSWYCTRSKVLADVAVADPATFAQIAEKAKGALG